MLGETWGQRNLVDLARLWKGRYLILEGTPPPSVSWNHWVRGKSSNNLCGSRGCGQNLELKELRSVVVRPDSQYGKDTTAAHRLCLDDDRRLGICSARSDVTWGCGKEDEFGNATVPSFFVSAEGCTPPLCPRLSPGVYPFG